NACHRIARRNEDDLRGLDSLEHVRCWLCLLDPHIMNPPDSWFAPETHKILFVMKSRRIPCRHRVGRFELCFYPCIGDRKHARLESANFGLARGNLGETPPITKEF